ncbi:MAG: type II/IV secretion system protein [Deltaproteobacteria bacterium]|nr:type II/IV secretion system protein [Deltaproteobacteria bacterium]
MKSREGEPLHVLGLRDEIDEVSTIRKLAEKLGIKYLDLTNPSVNGLMHPELFGNKIDKDLLWANNAFPISEDEDYAVIVFANPFNIEAQKAIEFLLAKPVKVAIAEEHKIKDKLAQYYPSDKLSYDAITAVENKAHVEIVGETEIRVADHADAESPPIVRLANMIISDAVISGASDIHIEPIETGVEVRFRIDGKMSHVVEVPKRLQSYLTSRFKLLAKMDIAEHRKPQDGRFRVRAHEKLIDMRVSCLPTAFGETVVLRLLQQHLEYRSFSEFGVTAHLEQKILQALESECKMFLVTGPTGSGKTTTLYNALHYLNDRTSNIVTVEDPIEYRLSGVNQVQVNETAGVTFAATLRSILRQDPDVIMVGEIRDKETAEIAVEASLTGHKVLSTLHTNDAPSAITRLKHLHVSPYSIGSSVSGILAQRLVRRICPDCVVEYEPTRKERLKMLCDQFELVSDKLTMGAGCKSCNNIGYKGRQGIYSFFEIDSTISDMLIKDEASLGEIVSHAKKNGFKEIHEVALDLVKDGLTTIDEVTPYLFVKHYAE